jgi:hypothetical protein
MTVTRMPIVSIPRSRSEKSYPIFVSKFLQTTAAVTEYQGSSRVLQSRMQILELDCDPWREQYFSDTESPTGVLIPNDDRSAYNLYAQHRWTYDRYLVARSQGLECGPHDLIPPRYPVFCKAVTALGSADGMMGGGEPAACSSGRAILNERDYREHCGVGDFWMTLLTGEQVSTDFAVVEGQAVWCRHTLAVTAHSGALDYWVVEERSRPRLDRYCREWIAANLSGYTGMVNLETIGGRIAEVHLRFADQWPDLYGRKWLDALVRLHQRGTWDLVDVERAEGYSFVLLGLPGSKYTSPSLQTLAACRAMVGISTVKSTLGDLSKAETAGRGAAVRLAVINSYNLDAGLRVRAALAAEMGAVDSGAHLTN